MSKLNFVEQHIIDCIRAAMVEARGEEQKAARLRAQGKLRLVCMSDEEIWELANRTCCPPRRPAEDAYYDIKQTIAEYRATTDEWLGKAFGGISSGSSR
ncbi:MAG: hypothetical protein PHV74_06185 [Dehalococcoidia bacterium]|nr:hypothetical protein [Dehalococcoidia bacterium]